MACAEFTHRLELMVRVPTPAEDLLTGQKRSLLSQQPQGGGGGVGAE